MRDQLEGSRAVAETVGRCRVQVVPAYPITPQTHIVEAIGAMVRDGTLPNCEFITVESEFGALSAAIGASAAGARAYTATASQGLLYMAEALFNASGLALPIVMTVANRAIGAPINIWNDHSDSMSQRDCGWIQLYAESNQAAADLHVLAFRLAEELSLPAMICMDGFLLTHAFEAVDVPEQGLVDRFLPHRRANHYLDPDEPVTIGAMVGPEAFSEVRYLAHQQLLRAEPRAAELAAEWAALTGRSVTALAPYRLAGAHTAVVALGSVSGAVQEAIDERDDAAGLLTLRLYRPFPAEAVRAALAGVRRVIVLERSFAPGMGGVVSADVRGALAGRATPVHTVVAGLGGRPITKRAIHDLLSAAAADSLPDLSFLDLNLPVVDRELARQTGIEVR
jgi:pyruvate ferredoxin oxidoreductase alpha subunit